jgi:hypothetical protein
MAAAVKDRGTRKKQAKSFPAVYRRLSPTRKLEWLTGAECGAMVRLGNLQATQVQAEARRIDKARIGVMQIAPSSANVEDWQGGQPFPPPAENTPMVQADRMLCRQEIPVLWPASYLSGGETYDVVVFKDLMRRAGIDGTRDLNHGTTESPNRIASDELQRRNVKLLARRLPTEDIAVLKQQISAYRRGLPTSILEDDLRKRTPPRA